MTLVTISPLERLRAVLRDWSPRNSLTARAVWLVIALAASFALAASLLVGSVARDIVVQQHVRRLALETDQLGSDLGQAVAARIGALHRGTYRPRRRHSCSASTPTFRIWDGLPWPTRRATCSRATARRTAP